MVLLTLLVGCNHLNTSSIFSKWWAELKFFTVVTRRYVNVMLICILRPWNRIKHDVQHVLFQKFCLLVYV